MRLLKLTIKGLRAIEHLEIDLSAAGQPRRRLVLLGPNGAGKTTLLAAIAHVFGKLDEELGAWSLGPGDLRQPRRASASATDENRSRGEVEIEGILTAEEWAGARSILPGAPSRGKIHDDLLGARVEFDDLLTVAEPNAFMQAAGLAVRQAPGAPCVYLPADRGVLGYEDVSATSLFELRPHADCLHPGRSRFSPLASRLGLAAAGERNDPGGAVKRMWKVLAEYFPEMPKMVDVKGLMLLFQLDDGTVLPLTSLSDGQRALLLLFGEIALRSPAHGVVLLDEPEQHLHPRWQGALVEALPALVPTAQFIFATQAPYIAAAAPADVVELGSWSTHGI